MPLLNVIMMYVWNKTCLDRHVDDSNQNMTCDFHWEAKVRMITWALSNSCRVQLMQLVCCNQSCTTPPKASQTDQWEKQTVVPDLCFWPYLCSKDYAYDLFSVCSFDIFKSGLVLQTLAERVSHARKTGKTECFLHCVRHLLPEQEILPQNLRLPQVLIHTHSL